MFPTQFGCLLKRMRHQHHKLILKQFPSLKLTTCIRINQANVITPLAQVVLNPLVVEVFRDTDRDFRNR